MSCVLIFSLNLARVALEESIQFISTVQYTIYIAPTSIRCPCELRSRRDVSTLVALQQEISPCHPSEYQTSSHWFAFDSVNKQSPALSLKCTNREQRPKCLSDAEQREVCARKKRSMQHCISAERFQRCSGGSTREKRDDPDERVNESGNARASYERKGKSVEKNATGASIEDARADCMATVRVIYLNFIIP